MYNPNYADFLKSKKTDSFVHRPIEAEIHEKLKPFQRDCAEFLLKIGRGAAFLDTGLGKTILQCEWARHIPCEVLLVAPLAVARQTINEAKHHLGIDIDYSKDGTIKGQFTITNYERVENFDCERFAGVVLDESSILKGQNSKTKAMLCSRFANTPYKLACTATPAPNDYTEIGNHAEFLGIMSTQEMLTRWFIHDSANTGDWRLKGHAVKPFWEWVASWAACVSKPSDLGYSNDGYELPSLNMKTHIIETETKPSMDTGLLFDLPDVNATSLHKKKRESVNDRVNLVADMVNGSSKPWIVWCESNQESEMLAKSIPDAVEVKGSDKPDKKEAAALFFVGYELSKEDLRLIGKIEEYEEWKSLLINKNTTVRIENAGLLSQKNGKAKTQKKKTSILRNTIATIEVNISEQETSKTKLIEEGERNTLKIKNTESSKREQSKSSTQTTQGLGKHKESESSELQSSNSMPCMKNLKDAVKFADLRTMETQGISLSSITAIKQGKFEGYYAATATLQSGTSMTILSECDLQSIIFPVRNLISKSSIFGFGLNFQHCRNMAFASISYSYEKFYQAVRRSWRFGQDEEVNVHVIIADAEIPVWRSVESKALDHDAMKDHMKYAIFSKGESSEIKIDYNPTHSATLPAWLTK